MFILSALALVLRMAKWVGALLTALFAGHFYTVVRDDVDFRAVLAASSELKRVLGLNLSSGMTKALIVAFEGLPMLFLGALTLVLLYGEKRVIQWNDDLSVRGFVGLLRKGLRKPFVLYLRAFDTTDALITPNTEPQLALPMLPSAVLRQPFYELEQTVRSAVGSAWKFVALGKPGEHIGAARILSADEAWQAEVIELVKASRLVVCVPSPNSGTRWEINHLRDTYQLVKTVFLMPPVSKRLDVQSVWELATNALSQEGLTLPRYQAAGAAFQLDRTGALTKTWDVDFQSPKTLRRVFREIVQASE